MNKNPITMLREELGITVAQLASGHSKTEVLLLEEGIPNSPPAWIYERLPTLSIDDYLAYKATMQRIYLTSLAPPVVPQTPSDFCQFLKEQELTPARFSQLARVPLAEVVHATRTRIPASVERFFSCTVH